MRRKRSGRILGAHSNECSSSSAAVCNHGRRFLGDSRLLTKAPVLAVMCCVHGQSPPPSSPSHPIPYASSPVFSSHPLPRFHPCAIPQFPPPTDFYQKKVQITAVTRLVELSIFLSLLCFHDQQTSIPYSTYQVPHIPRPASHTPCPPYLTTIHP